MRIRCIHIIFARGPVCVNMRNERKRRKMPERNFYNADVSHENHQKEK